MMVDSEPSDWSRLVLLSLAVVDEALDHARLGPVTRSLGLRCALAALYWCGDRSTRDPFHEFWQTLTCPLNATQTPAVQALSRFTNGDRLRAAMVRTLGLSYSAEIHTDVLKLAGKLPGWREREQRARDAKRVLEQRNARAEASLDDEAFAAAVEHRRRRDDDRRNTRGSS